MTRLYLNWWQISIFDALHSCQSKFSYQWMSIENQKGNWERILPFYCCWYLASCSHLIGQLSVCISRWDASTSLPVQTTSNCHGKRPFASCVDNVSIGEVCCVLLMRGVSYHNRVAAYVEHLQSVTRGLVTIRMLAWKASFTFGNRCTAVRNSCNAHKLIKVFISILMFRWESQHPFPFESNAYNSKMHHTTASYQSWSRDKFICIVLSIYPFMYVTP